MYYKNSQEFTRIHTVFSFPFSRYKVMWFGYEYEAYLAFRHFRLLLVVQALRV